MHRPFLLIAALVFATALACGENPARPATPDPATTKELQKSVSRAVGSYNSVDIQGLRREFSPKAPGLTDDGAFRRLFFRYYLEDLGRAKSMRFLPEISNFDPDRAMLIYEGAFDHWPHVRVSANFTRENGVPKLVQLRFEKIETAN
jgi:hypothetical protein